MIPERKTPPFFLAVLPQIPDLCWRLSPELALWSAVYFIPEQAGKVGTAKEHLQDSATCHQSRNHLGYRVHDSTGSILWRGKLRLRDEMTGPRP